MTAGRLNYFLTPLRLERSYNPITGETTSHWAEKPEIRAERVKFTAKAVYRGVESLIAADAVYLVRYRHEISDGWRVRDREGTVYNVVVEPNREKDLKLLKCTKVND